MIVSIIMVAFILFMFCVVIGVVAGCDIDRIEDHNEKDDDMFEN